MGERSSHTSSNKAALSGQQTECHAENLFTTVATDDDPRLMTTFVTMDHLGLRKILGHDRMIRDQARIKVLETEQNAAIKEMRALKTELEALKIQNDGAQKRQRNLSKQVSYANSRLGYVVKENAELQREVIHLDNLLTASQETLARWEAVADDNWNRGEQYKLDYEAALFDCEKQQDANKALKAKMEMLSMHAKRFFESSRTILDTANYGIFALKAQEKEDLDKCVQAKQSDRADGKETSAVTQVKPIPQSKVVEEFKSKTIVVDDLGEKEKRIENEGDNNTYPKGENLSNDETSELIFDSDIDESMSYYNDEEGKSDGEDEIQEEEAD